MARSASELQSTSRATTATLLPLMAVVLIAFLMIGLAIPVLPLHVHQNLGLGTSCVGLVTGTQFCASLVSRLWAGRFADDQGSKRTMTVGLMAAVAAGLLYLLSLELTATPLVSVTILLLGRAVLGAAESFILTGAVTWGLSRAGQGSAGKVIAWMGTSMFAAFVVGAPLGTALYARSGFGGIALATTLVPLATLLLIVPLRPVAPVHASGPKFWSVLREIWVPGVGAALSAVGFGTISTFSSLLFVERHWSPIWLPFTAYAGGLIAARLAFGDIPDRIGGAKAALFSVIVEAAGLALIYFAQSATMANFGAALSGLGYALVFPGFGVEVARRAGARGRGVAMGAYTACPDFALGVSGPALGLIAASLGLSVVFLISSATVLCAVVVAAWLLYAR